MRILTGQDVRMAVTMPEAITAVRGGFIALSTGQAVVPVRGIFQQPNGITLTMPAHIHGAAVSTVKVVSVFGGNRDKGLPVVMAAVLILDASTGAPLALLDGTVLTALRTGAASGVATDLLARPDAHILGVIGAGAQARTQIEAVCAVRPVTEICIHSQSGADELVAELQGRYAAEMRVASSAGDALAGADVIVTATNSPTPVIHRADIAPGAHINGVGSFTPGMQEVAADVVTQAKVVVDHRESAWAEAGDLIIPRDQGIFSASQVHAEIGEIAAGLKPGRESVDEITFFKSVGNAVQDAVVAAAVLDKAARLNLGTVAAL
ncbi:MAG: ornithine cyclodeaminase [Anaerolineae bacterium]|nr:ornithine cyclodeaminase [Anaerolineae bacterium]